MADPTLRDSLADIFRAVFDVPPGAPVDAIRQLTEPKWDSLAHVSLISAIESQFDLSVDTSESTKLAKQIESQS